ncbi:MAG: TonB-dependent receptor [Bacteroidales bacterium]|nr:TonB-dependent receptor [Bacteroidales bacterium]
MLLAVCFTLPAQQPTYTMKGKVYDETGAVPGVTIQLKNKPGGATTNADGEFTIRAQRGDMIVFSFLGFESVEYLVTEEKQDLEIQLAESSQQLEEVQVVALGSQRKISTVAAVSSLDVKDLQVPVASVANLLGGRIAGVVSLQTSGEPGKNLSEFWIRGIGTFGANASAMVLIDGLEGDINSLDPADIESFSILKDASATAVYGVRGANGVVLITTKKGQAGKMSITARANWTISHLGRMPDYLRAYDYAKLTNEALVLRGDEPQYDPVELDIIRLGLDPDLYPDVSWQREVMRRNSFKQQYYLSARGGADVATYFFSLGGSKEDAAYKYDKSVYSSNVGYNTYTYRLNLDLNLTKTTKVYFGTDGFISINNTPGVSNTDWIWNAQGRLNPLLLPVRYSNGELPAARVGDLTEISPSVMVNHMGRRSDQEFKGKATLAITQDMDMLVKGLKVKVQGAYDNQSFFNEARIVTPALFEAQGRDTKGELVTINRQQADDIGYLKTTNTYRKYHLETNLNWERVIADKHRVSALVYYYLSDEKYSSASTTNLNAIPVRYQGVSSRLTYGFKDTYMIDFNFGYNGSENFQPGRQYGFFPSIAVGWVLTGYDYVRENMPWVNLFKIRASHGTVGNDRISNNQRFPYLTTVNSTSYGPWGSSLVEVVNDGSIGADNLEWEKGTKSNVGIDARFLKDKISFVLDFFNDVRNGIFQQRVQVPDYAGLPTLPYGNVGKMRSYGADGNVSFMHEINQNMSFTVRGNFTYSNNVVSNWEEANPKYPYQGKSDYPFEPTIGYQNLGFFKSQHDIDTSPIQTFGTVMPGDLKYRDVNGDGKIDGDDRVPLTFSNYPRLMYGFGGEFRYRNLSLGVLFKGTGDTHYFRNGYGYVPFYDGKFGNVLSSVNDPANRWIPIDYAVANGIDPSLAENPNAKFPRLRYGRDNNNTQTSDFWKANSRYLRLQEITLNYNLRNPVLQKIGVSSIDLQFVGNNLYVWDKVKDFDPEQASRNGIVYPIPTTYTLQIYINL